jgi:hypothetical protein
LAAATPESPRLGELALAPADLLERVAGRLALLAAARGHTGAQLERAQLLGGQRRALEGVVLALDDHVPAQHRQLAGRRDDGDLHAAAGADALEEGAQRSRRLCRHPGGLDQHAAGVGVSLLGDPAV